VALDEVPRIGMLIQMRTTLVLDDTLLRQAKPVAPPFFMVTYGGGETPVHHEPSDFKDLLDDEDRKRSG
jgi:hypothetical protein